MYYLKKRALLSACYFMLAAIPLLIYGDVFNFSFVSWDDDINVFENPFLKDFSIGNIGRFWSAPYADLYIPVTYSVWFLTGLTGNLLSNAGHSHLNPAYFHGVNLTLHILNGFLVFSVLNVIFGKKKGRGESAAPAFIGALFFILHPVQTEPVCWVTGMKDLLAGFFSLLSLYTRFSPGEPGSINRKYYRLVPVTCFLAALLSKPSAVTLPLAVLVIECAVLKKALSSTLLKLSPWFSLSLIAVLVSQVSQSNKISTSFNIWKQVAAVMEASGFYIIKLLFPFNLSADYGHRIVNILENNELWTLSIIPASAIALMFIYKWEFMIPVTLFFIFLLPVLGFVPFAFQSISIVADRYMYMALFGVSTGVTLFFKKLPERRLLLFTPLFVTLICFSLISSFSARRWQSSFELFNSTIITNPDSYISYNNLGIHFFKMRNYADASHYFKEALKINPVFFLSRFNLANSLANLNQPDKAERQYKNALKENPEHLLANYNLGIIYIRSGKYADATRQFEKAVSIDNSYAPAYLDLGKLMAARQKYSKAVYMYQMALKADDNLTDAYIELGAIHFKLGNFAKSSFFYKKAITLDPENIELRRRLKDSLQAEGEKTS